MEHGDSSFAASETNLFNGEIARNRAATASLGSLGSDASIRVLSDRPAPVLLDPDELVLRMGDRTVSLTPKQFSILAYLVQKAGSWVTTGEIISEVLRTHHKPDTSLIRVHVHAIRRRLGDDAAYLQSDPLRSRGYRWSGGRGNFSERFAREPIP